MPFINGKFYMIPAYGRALEDARTSEATGKDQGSHWVTIEGHHVLIDETRGLRSPHGTQEHAERYVDRADRRPGSKAARIVFNETSGLRPANKNPEDLHDARVAMSHTHS